MCTLKEVYSAQQPFSQYLKSGCPVYMFLEMGVMKVCLKSGVQWINLENKCPVDVFLKVGFLWMCLKRALEVP